MNIMRYLIVAVAGMILGAYIFRSCSKPNEKVVEKTNTIFDTLKVETYVDRAGIEHTIYVDKPVNDVSDGLITYTADTLLPALQAAAQANKEKDVQIEELTRINGSLTGEITGYQKKIDELGREVLRYEDKYIVIEQHDSTVSYSGDIKIDVVGFSTRKKSYVDISSPNKNFKLNGVERFRQNLTPYKEKGNLSAELGLSVGLRNPTSLWKAGAIFKFNPAGKISPRAGLGYMGINGNIQPYAEAGINFNFLHF